MSWQVAPAAVKTVCFEDFATNAFSVTVSKVQQVALARAGSRVPRPSEQLALVAERRKQKHAVKHACITRFSFSCRSIVHVRKQARAAKEARCIVKRGNPMWCAGMDCGAPEAPDGQVHWTGVQMLHQGGGQEAVLGPVTWARNRVSCEFRFSGMKR